MKYRVMKVVDFEYDTAISAIHTDTPKTQPLRGVYCKQPFHTEHIVSYIVFIFILLAILVGTLENNPSILKILSLIQCLFLYFWLF